MDEQISDKPEDIWSYHRCVTLSCLSLRVDHLGLAYKNDG
ncbi:hypothetical protein C2W64_00244 [Brevibacillus laterosporus]|nr:hypothetical protein C2W64_00244 [Brevibacillus laterosporus]